MATTVHVENANRMMTSASIDERDIKLTFADGLSGLIPLADIREVAGLDSVESLSLPNPYMLLLNLSDGQVAEIPWDFARHYCDATYRPRVEAIAAQGEKIAGQTYPEYQAYFRNNPGESGLTRGNRADHPWPYRTRRAIPSVRDVAGNCGGTRVFSPEPDCG